MKFVGVLLDENLSWKEHIYYLENKIAKTIGFMYIAKPFLTRILVSIILLLYPLISKLC